MKKMVLNVLKTNENGMMVLILLPLIGWFIMEKVLMKGKLYLS